MLNNTHNDGNNGALAVIMASASTVGLGFAFRPVLAVIMGTIGGFLLAIIPAADIQKSLIFLSSQAGMTVDHIDLPATGALFALAIWALGALRQAIFGK